MIRVIVEIKHTGYNGTTQFANPVFSIVSHVEIPNGKTNGLEEQIAKTTKVADDFVVTANQIDSVKAGIIRGEHVFVNEDGETSTMSSIESKETDKKGADGDGGH